MSAVGNLIGGSSTPSAPPATTVFQPSQTEQQTADTTLNSQTAANVANNPYTTINPQLSSLLTSLFSNPYSAGAQTAANTAGTQLTTAGTAANTAATNLYGQVGNDQAAANQVLTTAFDPQSALYNQTLQQLTDQVNSSEASRGITAGGVGENIMDNALTNFNVDWQAQQLANQATGLTAANTANTGAATVAGDAATLAGTGANYTGQSGALPNETYMNNITGTNSAASGVAGTQADANTTNQLNISDLLSYLGFGTSAATAQSNANNTAYQNELAEAQMNQNSLGGLTSALGSGISSSAAGNSIWTSLGAALA